MLVNQDERKLTQFTGWLCSNLTYLHFKKSYIALYQHLCQHHMDAKMINVSKSIAYTRKKINAYEVFRLDIVMGYAIMSIFWGISCLNFGNMYENILGYSQDKKIAYHWQNKFPDSCSKMNDYRLLSIPISFELHNFIFQGFIKLKMQNKIVNCISKQSAFKFTLYANTRTKTFNRYLKTFNIE